MTRQAVLEMLLERVQKARGQSRGLRAPQPSTRIPSPPSPALSQAAPPRAPAQAAPKTVASAPLNGDRQARLETLLARVLARRRR